MTAAEIAQKLGGATRSGEWWRCRCPVHRGASPSLALRDAATGIVIKCHAGCLRWQVIKELERLRLARTRPASESETAEFPQLLQKEKSRIANAREIWDNAYGADANTLIDNYLRSRGITLPPPPTIRVRGSVYHPESGERRPAMVAKVEHALRGHTAVHLTFLAIDGSGKATVEPNRKMIGVVAGGAVRLAPVDPCRWLVVAEGVENALSVMQMTGLPGWAALSAGGIEHLVLPPEAGRVLICADNDVNGQGEAAARKAAERWLAEGREVRLKMPSAPGSDFNDALIGQGNSHG